NWWCLLFPPLCFGPVLAEEAEYTLPEPGSTAGDKDITVFPPAPRLFLLEILQKAINFLLEKIFA
ncbi:MAG: hypothetical protein GX767_09025, partial [Firmicutes bacterium]|nr:hypothetical protein [Bacillota bacterium]